MYISMNFEFIIKELYQLIKIDVFSNLQYGTHYMYV